MSNEKQSQQRSLRDRTIMFILSLFDLGELDNKILNDDIIIKTRFDFSRGRGARNIEPTVKTITIPIKELEKELEVAESFLNRFDGMEVFPEKRHYECFVSIDGKGLGNISARDYKPKIIEDSEVVYTVGRSSLSYSLFCLMKYLNRKMLSPSLSYKGDSSYVWQMRRYRTIRRISSSGELYVQYSRDWKEVITNLLGINSLSIDFGRRSTFSQARDRANSFEFKFMYCNNIAIRRVTDTDEFLYRRLLRNEIAHERKLDCPPTKKYDKEAVNYYCLALSSDDPYVQYLSFYHVLERFFDRAYKHGITQKLRDMLTEISFSLSEDSLFSIVKMIEKESGNKLQAGYGNEKNELVYLLIDNIDVASLSSELDGSRESWKDYYMSTGVAFEPDAPKIDWESSSVIQDIANRVYKVRNAVIHSKQRADRVYRPFLHEAALAKEIPLIRCLAERVIDGTGDLYQSF